MVSANAGMFDGDADSPSHSMRDARVEAESFADELARLGYSAPHILQCFDDPRSGMCWTLRELGELVVRRLIVRAVLRRPGARAATRSERDGH